MSQWQLSTHKAVTSRSCAATIRSWPSAARPLSVEAGTKRTFVQGTWNVVMRNREGVEAKKGARQYAEPLFAHNKSVQLCGENATAATMPATTTVRTSGQATCRQFPMNVCSIISILFGSNVRILSIMGRTARCSCRAVHNEMQDCYSNRSAKPSSAYCAGPGTGAKLA
jgi:hypothetical protein